MSEVSEIVDELEELYQHSSPEYDQRDIDELILLVKRLALLCMSLSGRIAANE